MTCKGGLGGGCEAHNQSAFGPTKVRGVRDHAVSPPIPRKARASSRPAAAGCGQVGASADWAVTIAMAVTPTQRQLAGTRQPTAQPPQPALAHAPTTQPPPPHAATDAATTTDLLGGRLDDLLGGGRVDELHTLRLRLAQDALEVANLHGTGPAGGTGGGRGWGVGWAGAHPGKLPAAHAPSAVRAGGHSSRKLPSLLPHPAPLTSLGWNMAMAVPDLPARPVRPASIERVGAGW